MADENLRSQAEGTETASDQFQLPASTGDMDSTTAGDSAGPGGPDPAAANPFPASSPGTSAGGSEKPLAQDDIDMLLKQAGLGSPTPAATASATAVHPPAGPRRKGPEGRAAAEGELAPGDLDLLFSQAQRALASINANRPQTAPPPGATAFRLEQFAGAPASTEMATLDLVRDVSWTCGSSWAAPTCTSKTSFGSAADRSSPWTRWRAIRLNVFVNGRLIARGEVLVLNDNFCVRVAELVVGNGSG